MEFRLKELRKEKGYTQTQLAKKINCSQAQIVYWENGQNEPTATFIVKIAKIFNVSISYLLGIENEDKTYTAPQLSENEQHLIDDYNRLNRFAKKQLRAYLDLMLENPNAIDQII